MRPCSCSTLLDAPCGKKLRVNHLDGTRAEQSRLCSLGILPGTELEVCHNAAKGKGCVCVRVRCGSVVLGESMAKAVRLAEKDGSDSVKAEKEASRVRP